MNVVVTVFYAIAIAWFIGLGVFVLIKKIKSKKSDKKNNKDDSDGVKK